ncbi:hypothetical protein FACS189449_01010 [Alphaproteobacteria bacterium]|nr:hypothetical protein FACS189449_01010 [Alphaproteobacteria bacterium]
MKRLIWAISIVTVMSVWLGADAVDAAAVPPVAAAAADVNALRTWFGLGQFSRIYEALGQNRKMDLDARVAAPSEGDNFLGALLATHGGITAERIACLEVLIQAGANVNSGRGPESPLYCAATGTSLRPAALLFLKYGATLRGGEVPDVKQGLVHKLRLEPRDQYNREHIVIDAAALLGSGDPGAEAVVAANAARITAAMATLLNSRLNILESVAANKTAFATLVNFYITIPGVNINARTINGANTLLHIAASHRYYDVATTLVNAGASLYAVNNTVYKGPGRAQTPYEILRNNVDKYPGDYDAAFAVHTAWHNNHPDVLQDRAAWGTTRLWKTGLRAADFEGLGGGIDLL